MNIEKYKTLKLSPKVTLVTLLTLLAIIAVSSIIYYNKVASGLSASSMNLTPIVAKVQAGVAEVNYFATTSNAQVLARYPKGDKVAADYIYNQIGTFIEEVGDSGHMSSAPNQFIAPFSTSTSSNTKTIIFKIYKYTGGAHGMVYTKAIIRDVNANIIEVKDLLSRYDMNKIAVRVEQDLKEAYFEIVMKDLKRDINMEEFYKSDEGESALKWISEGSIATSTNYSVAWEDGDNLNVYISQYQAWPYAYGDYIVSIPISQIRK